jgi:APA family basic amino acid/polyamine antiporter
MHYAFGAQAETRLHSGEKSANPAGLLSQYKTSIHSKLWRVESGTRFIARSSTTRMMAGASQIRVNAEKPAYGGGLSRRLGIGTSTALVVGFVIGSGIFRVPGHVAAEAGGVGAALLAWMVGGAVVLCGSLSLAELGAMFPRAGGVYVFLYEAYGPEVAFLKGWMHLIVGPSSWAAVALIFADYTRTFFPMTQTGARFLAAALIAILAAMGCRSVSVAASVQAISTWLKVTALLAMATALFILHHGSAGAMATPGFASSGWSGLGLALIPVMFAYDGWNGFTAMSGEVRNPGRTIPISLAVGVTAVAAVYLVVNLAYFTALPFDVLQRSPHVAADAVSRVAGPAGTSIIAALVMLTTFSALNATVMIDPRIYFAMAESGLFFRSVARVHPRWGTPYVAIVLNASLAVFYVFIRSFDQLAEAFVLGVWPFLALAVTAVLVLRRTRAELPRPYRTTGYPVVPIIFIVASVALILNAMYRHPISTATSLGITLIGLPVYWVWRKSSYSRIADVNPLL